MRIVLASSSPSRLKVLRSAGVRPLVDAPRGVDEDALLAGLRDTPSGEVVAALAAAKADEVASRHAGEVIIGGDSMLFLDGELQGKPHTVERTIDRWRTQRGRAAELITGHCIIGPSGQRVVETIRSTVYFAEASDADIEAYARTKEPLGCAGAFTLEALGGWFIDRVDGDPSAVLGLSLPLVRRALYGFGLQVSDFWTSEASRI